MCGIAGWAGAVPESPRERLAAMLARLVHRGPDDERSARGEGWALGARRLAILDLATGGQPVRNEDGSVVAVLNGEIYNYLELRAELLARGHRLRSTGDTEVLVHLWEDEGERLPERLRGMFALALVDTRRRVLFLARDRLGKKPLYLARQGPALWFASELKALRAGVPTLAGADEAALRSFLAFGFVPEGECMVPGVRKLAPGHRAVFELDGGRWREERYWRLTWAGEWRAGRGAVIEEVRARLAEAVRLRLRADVPVAVFLSGGIDSGLVAALAAPAAPGLRALTVTFGRADDELALARRTAARAGLEVVPVPVDASAGVALLPHLAEVFDEPLADPSVIPTVLVARAARAFAPVVLNGDGGDEVFAGYRRYQAARLAALPGAGLAPPLLRRLGGWGWRVAEGLGGREHPYLAWGPSKLGPGGSAAVLGGDEVLPAALTDVLGRVAGEPLPQQLRAADLEFFLPGDLLVKMDRASMAASLEARSPLLDYQLVEYAASLPPSLLFSARGTKPLLRAAAAGLLPRAVRRAPKRGFEVPLVDWLAGPWAGEVRAVFEDPSAALRRVIPGERLAPWREWRSHPDPQRSARAVFTLLTLEHWLRRWG